jgi:ribonuclease E
LSVRIEAHPHLISPDFEIEKFKTATRVVPEASMPVISAEVVHGAGGGRRCRAGGAS